MRGAAMGLTAAVGGSIVLLLTVTVIQGQNGWGVTYTSKEICALKGSTVEMSCTYTYPTRMNGRDTKVEETFWFTKASNDVYVDLRTDPEYSGRVQYSCDNNKCTLRITDLRESDSAEYKFRFMTNISSGRYSGSPGVILSVTDFQVQVNTYTIYQAELTCQISCRLPGRPHYVWYRNEEKIQGQAANSYLVSFDPANSYSCAVEGYEKSRSAPVSVKDSWDVTYTSPQICAFKQSTVNISCTYRYPTRINSHNTKVKEKIWFTKASNDDYVDLETDSEYSDRVRYFCDDKKCTLRITDLRQSDSAVYKFRFTTNHSTGKYSGLPGVTLSVTDPQLAVHVSRSSVNQYVNWTELTCYNTCQLPDHSSYIWYNDGQKLEGKDAYFHPNPINPADRYSCAVSGFESFTSLPVYAPKLPSVLARPSAEIVENSSVTLNCSSDANPAANYTWYKKNGDPDPRPLSKEAELVFRSIQSSVSGEYYCTAENELGRMTSESISIHVKYAPKLPSVSVRPSAEIVENSSVTLNCSSDANPAANYTWYKKNGDPDPRPLRKEAELVFRSIQSSDSGEYYCTAENELRRRTSESISIHVKYPPRLPSVSVSPSGEIMEGSSVNLSCSSDANPAANYTWYKQNEDSPKASGQIFTITDVRPEHSGNYYCEAQNSRGRHSSTLHLNVVADPLAWKSAAIGTTLALFLAFICLIVFLLIRKKRSAEQSAKPEDRPDNTEQSVEQDHLHYASIHFSHNQTDPVYYNIRQAGPHTQREEEEEQVVEYTAIKFKSAGGTPRTRGPDLGEDPATLYSTVNKQNECKRNF